MLILFVAFFTNAIAEDWPMGSYDFSGSRHQPESSFTKRTVSSAYVKWFRPNPAAVLCQPVIVDDYAYYGDATGAYFAINISTGTDIWTTQLSGLVSNGAFVRGNKLYVCTIFGYCYCKNRFTGINNWVAPQPNAVWSTPLLIGDILYVSLNPSEDTVTEEYLREHCCQKRASLRLLNAHTGVNITETFWIPPATFINVTVPLPNVYDGLGSNTTFRYGPSGASTWGDLAYSPELGLIFAATGQANSPNASGLAPHGVDSMIAFRLDGSIKWIKSVRELRNNDINDIYNSGLYFNPLKPIDMDLGNGPMVYKTKIRGHTRTVVATGDKQGNWYIFDAETGDVLNGNGYEALLPGPPVAGSSGGFNLQSAYFKQGSKVRCIGNLVSSFNLKTCSTSGGTESECVRYDWDGNYSSSIVSMKDDGSGEHKRYSKTKTHFLGGIAITNKMVVVRDAFNKKLVFLDATKLNKVIHTVDLSAHLTGRDFGANIAIGGGDEDLNRKDVILVGTGYGATSGHGLIGIGLP